MSLREPPTLSSSRRGTPSAGRSVRFALLGLPTPPSPPKPPPPPQFFRGFFAAQHPPYRPKPHLPPIFYRGFFAASAARAGCPPLREPPKTRSSFSGNPYHPRAYSFILLLTQIKDPREANQEFRIKNSDGEGRRLDDPLVGAGIDCSKRIKNK